jgi:hypothetical protein
MYSHERSLVKRLQGKPFALLGINSDKDLDQLHARMVEERITWPSWWDGGGTGGPIASTFGVRAWPTIYVLDAKGVIRFKGVRGEEMDRAVNSLLDERAQDPKAARADRAK